MKKYSSLYILGEGVPRKQITIFGHLKAWVYLIFHVPLQLLHSWARMPFNVYTFGRKCGKTCSAHAHYLVFSSAQVICTCVIVGAPSAQTQELGYTQTVCRCWQTLLMTKIMSNAQWVDSQVFFGFRHYKVWNPLNTDNRKRTGYRRYLTAINWNQTCRCIRMFASD